MKNHPKPTDKIAKLYNELSDEWDIYFADETAALLAKEQLIKKFEGYHPFVRADLKTAEEPEAGMAVELVFTSFQQSKDIYHKILGSYIIVISEGKKVRISLEYQDNQGLK